MIKAAYAVIHVVCDRCRNYGDGPWKMTYLNGLDGPVDSQRNKKVELFENLTSDFLFEDILNKTGWLVTSERALCPNHQEEE